MVKTQEELINEEQRILDKFICEMEGALLELDEELAYKKLSAKKAKESCLSDAYGSFIEAETRISEIRERKRNISLAKDTLYEARLELDLDDENECDSIEIKVGLHKCVIHEHIAVREWKDPLCRNYLLDNVAEEYDDKVERNGETYVTHYKLKLKRKMEIFFEKVKNVTHFFPILDEETEQIIADEFLQKLLNRRSGQEFKNIVFSIQKKQGEIIQTSFKQDLIVQGCAGSGKSMIMLHRLPILLYDNPNSLDKNNLYIITPSIAYIQMANKMRIDLEIDDLKMGTLKQYYDYVIRKYRIDSEIYGTIKYYKKLKSVDHAYVYSTRCVKDICEQIKKIVKKGAIDYKTAYSMLCIKESAMEDIVTVPADIIRREVVKIQKALNQNDKNLRSYYRNIVDVLAQLDEFARMLETRKTAIIRGILRRIDEQKSIIIDKEKEISKIENYEEHRVKYKNCLNFIKAAQNRIVKLKNIQEIVECDEGYFERLRYEAKKVRQILEIFVAVKCEQEVLTFTEQYQMMENKELLCMNCNEIIKSVSTIEDPYWEYTNSIASEIEKLERTVEDLINNDSLYLPQDYTQKLIDAKEYYSEITNSIVHKIYLSLMKDLGQEPDEKGNLDALECSPYLYLQILYQFRGVPNGEKESLITIDEAQNIAPEELRLIKAVNGNKVVLNLFGDVKQHIEGDKGIDDWNDISDIANFKKEYMQENYRNARQITNYCNKRFKLNMLAINLDGTGVHEIKDETGFEDSFFEIFQKPQNLGLSCIIVKNKEEAATLLEDFGVYASRIHDMTKESDEIQRRKWNLMTVEQSKGLEFETVFAITGRMSENEKYITYTRALDELYIYDKKIKLNPVSPETKEIETSKKIKKQENSRKKREKRSSKKETGTEPNKRLKEFFEEKGLEVIDNRTKSGHLWVIGSKEKIDSVVNEAMEIYGAAGDYGSGKVSGFREGWFTKSKK